MSQHENLKIIAFVGLSGAGKTTAVTYLTDKGYPKVYFGGIVYQAMADAGIEKGEERERVFRVEIREREGQDYVVKRIIQQIHDLATAGQHRIVADGLYTWDEYKRLKTEFPGELTVVAIVAPRHLRHHRLEQRVDRPQTEAISSSRDWDEIEQLQKGGPIAVADYYVINNEDEEHFYAQINHITESINF